MSSLNIMSAEKQTSNTNWHSLVPFLGPPVAAAVAVIPVFRDLMVKSFQQKGEKVPYLNYCACLKAGLKAAPTVGTIVGTQMILQKLVEKTLMEETKGGLLTNFESAAVVGTLSAPILAAFNGQIMGWSIQESFRRFSLKQGMAISIQETAFVAGLTAADKLALHMKNHLGDKKVVDYLAAFAAGAAGSLAGHPANTALTRWQSGMPINHLGQLMWGSFRKTYAIGCFSVLYKLGKETLNSAVS